jgi:hypothetical protein
MPERESASGIGFFGPPATGRFVPDTKVLSALVRQSPDIKRVIDAPDQQPCSSIWTTSVTILEIRFGLQILPIGGAMLGLASGIRESPC